MYLYVFKKRRNLLAPCLYYFAKYTKGKINVIIKFSPRVRGERERENYVARKVRRKIDYKLAKKTLRREFKGNAIILKYQVHMRATNKCTVWSMEWLAGNEQGGGPGCCISDAWTKKWHRERGGEGEKERNKAKNWDETARCATLRRRVIYASRLFMCGSCLPGVHMHLHKHNTGASVPSLRHSVHYLRTRVIHNSFFR